MSQAEISRLKKVARKAYAAYHTTTAGLDCGNTVAQIVSPTAATHANNFNAAMRRLQQIDPQCPKWEPL